MPQATLTRIVNFSASHRYFRPDWSDERNAATFGACAREHGHGHTYTCSVTVAGPLDPDTSMVMALGALDAILGDEVVEVLDHRHLNLDIPEFAYGETVPTGEALAVFVWQRVARRLPAGVRLRAVRIEEEPHLYAEYFGE
jgi:6-pyruvoyltetrahydropterin/6-carboxytetrahydropterin synthase